MAFPPLPGRRLLVALHGLVLLQLVPWPPAVLRRLSPGSFSFYNDPLLVPLTAWRPISVSPPDTLRGLAFLAAFTLLYAAVFREFDDHRWRRSLLLTPVAVGLAITVVAFVQAVSPEPRKIYGLWRPQWDWAVFGPYVNRDHFAGYLVMAVPLAMGFALESQARLRHAWHRHHRGWLVLGDAEGNTFVLHAVLVMVLVAGLLATQSRGGVGAFALTALLLSLVSRRRRHTALAVALLAGLGLAWIGLGGVVGAFEARGLRGRLELWLDMLPMVKRFPAFGVGLNAFSTAYPWYQTVWRSEWIGEAHNEYLQALIDLGISGGLLVAALLLLVFRAALRGARRGGRELGLFGALAGLALHNLVDFNWQIPAHAATWTALAALALRSRGTTPLAPPSPHNPLKREGREP
jgi:O-antigen ligase